MNGPRMRHGKETTGTPNMVSELLTAEMWLVRCSATLEAAGAMRHQDPERSKRGIGSR